jgi:hypothetical protein
VPTPETIALPSVISSGAVGVAAILGSLLGGWRDRAGSRNLQREERRQERLKNAYEALIGYIEKRIRIAARIRPIITYENEPPLPPIRDEEVDRAQALVDIHASPEVNQLVEEFSEKFRNIENAEFALRANDKSVKTRGQDLDAKAYGFPDWVEPGVFVSLDGIKQLRDIKDRLRQQMRQELNPG